MDVQQAAIMRVKRCENMETEKVLEIKDVTKTYGMGSLRVEALKETSLFIEKGSFNAIIGKSGSGKSTLLHILGTLDRPTTGSVYLGGKEISTMSEEKLAILRRRKIGFIFQSFNLLPEHTVLENILMPLHLDGKDAEKEYLDEVLKTLEIEEKKEYYPGELSGGQQQRVAIARAIVSKPALILADEPTGNLDTTTGSEVIGLLKKTSQKYGQTIVVVTHDMEIANQADRIITIRDGVVSG